MVKSIVKKTIIRKTVKTRFKSCGIFGRDDEDLSYIIGGIISFLKNRKVKIMVEENFSKKFNTGFEFSIPEIVSNAEFVLSLGGDGTMLRVASLFIGKSTPIVGINVGSVGFLTCGNQRSTQEILENILTGNFSIQRKRALKIINKNDNETFFSINDAVFLREPSSKMPTFRIDILNENSNYETVGSYRSDGLIISTPLGSTAYSLACNGPIVMPGTDAIILNLIAPYSLSFRPIIVPGSVKVHISIITDGALNTYFDGVKKTTLSSNTKFDVALSDKFVNTVKTEGSEGFFSILRKKLGWK